jgi:integrase/recombinase XerD
MMAAERGAARNTLLAYRTTWRSSCAAAGTWQGPSRRRLREHLAGLASRGFAPRTQARKLSSLRQFFRFLAREGLRQDDPTELLDSPKAPAPLPRALTEAEMDDLIMALPRCRTRRRRSRSPRSSCSTRPACASQSW